MSRAKEPELLNKWDMLDARFFIVILSGKLLKQRYLKLHAPILLSYSGHVIHCME